MKSAARPALAPPVKWVGGKRAYAPRIIEALLVNKPRFYVEPFVGGGSVMLAMPKMQRTMISDVNPTLIDIWRCLQRAPSTLVTRLHKYEAQFGNGPEGYADARVALNKMIHVKRQIWIDRAALALYINARCFNGIWRTNREGVFNVPFGKRKNPTTISVERAQLYAEALGVTNIFDLDFRKMFEIVCHEDSTGYRPLKSTAIYVDPPYDQTFDDYAAGGFDEVDQRELAEWLKYFAGQGARVVANNLDTPLVREIYSWAKLEPMEELHVVGSTGARRGKRGCLLITNGV